MTAPEEPRVAPAPRGFDEARPAPPVFDEARPAPRYGEYATPDEQRAAIRQPLPDAPAPAGPAPVAEQPVTSRTRGSRADRVITLALLVYGLLTVVTGVPQLLDFTGFMDAWRDVAGVETPFTNVEEGRRWGAIGAAAFAGGWLLTALASVVLLRRGRAAWWMPLVGAIATFLVVSVCLSVPILGDPGMMAHFGR